MSAVKVSGFLPVGSSDNLFNLSSDFFGVVGDLVCHVLLDPGHGGVAVHELHSNLFESVVQQIDEFLVRHDAEGSKLRMIQEYVRLLYAFTFFSADKFAVRAAERYCYAKKIVNNKT